MVYVGSGGALQRVTRYDLSTGKPPGWLPATCTCRTPAAGPTVYAGFTAAPGARAWRWPPAPQYERATATCTSTVNDRRAIPRKFDLVYDPATTERAERAPKPLYSAAEKVSASAAGPTTITYRVKNAGTSRYARSPSSWASLLRQPAGRDRQAAAGLLSINTRRELWSRGCTSLRCPRPPPRSLGRPQNQRRGGSVCGLITALRQNSASLQWEITSPTAAPSAT
ncbi:MAG: hypothetical protein WKG07_11660 [Hymenobacter sp.]